MHISLLALHYTRDTLIGFTFLDLIAKHKVYIDSNTIVPVLRDSSNLVYGLGLDSRGNFIGTSGVLDRYTKIVDGGIRGALNMVVVARCKDMYLLASLYSTPAELSYHGVIRLMEGARNLGILSNARLSTKGYISSIRGNFYLGYKFKQ